MSLIDGLTETFGSFLSQAETGDQVRDYQHATRMFVDSLYRLSPKFSNMFHVYIDINSQVSNINGNGALAELGMLAKSVDLPSFTIDTKSLNQYNRKNIVQRAIKYDPINITFHDDSADVARNFWYDYYSHYFRDSDYPESTYQADKKYVSAGYNSYWGYTPRTDIAGMPYINRIRIYSLHQKKFSSYTLFSPIIKSFKHGQHESGKWELMDHKMAVEYTAVKYSFGSVNSNTVVGMQTIHYDFGPSPLSSLGGGTQSLFGPGGLVDSVSDVAQYLGDGNYLGAGLAALHTYNNFKNASISRLAKGELSQIGMDVLRSQVGGNRVFVPPRDSLSGLGSASTIANSRNS